ncbi:hypothetical protein [Ruminococcus sp.]|uniref:hypothetical protein n=1 Tax=Ruminococcus sp. TaxID=41978 RepID=UPI001B4B2616|nr:hypothetical protein [Ruminococcus sp.]MBP5430707.1 hypothetical protein [Ruminococcus sp.]
MSFKITEKNNEFTAAVGIGFANVAELSEIITVSDVKYINKRMSISAGESGCGYATVRSCSAAVFYRGAHTYSIAFGHDVGNTSLRVPDTAVQRSRAAHNADRESVAVCASEEKGNKNSIIKRCYNDWEN